MQTRTQWVNFFSRTAEFTSLYLISNFKFEGHKLIFTESCPHTFVLLITIRTSVICYHVTLYWPWIFCEVYMNPCFSESWSHLHLVMTIREGEGAQVIYVSMIRTWTIEISSLFVARQIRGMNMKGRHAALSCMKMIPTCTVKIYHWYVLKYCTEMLPECYRNI